MSQQKPTPSLAAAAVALALSPLAVAADNPPGSSGKAINAGDKVHCYGLNFCNSQCGTLACRNRRDCDLPWITTAKSCLDKGGSLAIPDKGDRETPSSGKDS